jgi:hypothetical protein
MTVYETDGIAELAITAVARLLENRARGKGAF